MNTMNTRLEMIRNTLLESLSTDGGSDALAQLKPTPKELLTLAMREEKFTGTIGMCGTECNDSCKWCSGQQWENEQRFQKELDDILSTVEESNAYSCATCGDECIPYDANGEVHWLCETCYYGKDELTIGYCGFSCDGYCNTCGGAGGYDGADEI
jgi:hypothetical protein